MMACTSLGSTVVSAVLNRVGAISAVSWIDPRLAAMLLVPFLLILILTGCGGGTTKVRPGSDSGTGSNPEEVGAVELASNTDPRFYIQNVRGRIGKIITKGNQVFKNNRPISGQVWLMNGERVSTGNNSAARIVFYARPGLRSCVIQISQFKSGRLYGSSDEKGRDVCEQKVITAHGESRVLKRSRYYMTVNRGKTDLLVKQGQVEARPTAEPSKQITINSSYSIKLMQRSYQQPQLLNSGQLQQRTLWREQLQLDKIQIMQPLNPVTPVR